MEDIENRSRRNNLIFHGIAPVKENETWDDCESLLKNNISEKMGLDGQNISIDRAHRLKSSSGRPAPIIARFTTFKDKERVMKERRKLKGSDVFINEDFSLNVRETRKQLKPFMSWFRSENKHASLVFDHLRVDGERFDYDPNTQTVLSKRDKHQFELPNSFRNKRSDSYRRDRGDRRDASNSRT